MATFVVSDFMANTIDLQRTQGFSWDNIGREEYNVSGQRLKRAYDKYWDEWVRARQALRGVVYR